MRHDAVPFVGVQESSASWLTGCFYVAVILELLILFSCAVNGMLNASLASNIPFSSPNVVNWVYLWVKYKRVVGRGSGPAAQSATETDALMLLL